MNEAQAETLVSTWLPGGRKRGNEYAVCCPIHQENTPSFHFNAHKGFFHCFGCGAHGDIIDLCMVLFRVDTREAIEAFEDMLGLRPESRGIEGDERCKN